MKPLIYSVIKSEKTQVGWYRDGFNIAYYQSTRKNKNAGNTLGQPVKLMMQ